MLYVYVIDTKILFVCVCVLTECWPGSACCLETGSWGRARCRAHALPNSRELWVIFLKKKVKFREKNIFILILRCILILRYPRSPTPTPPSPTPTPMHSPYTYVWMCSYFQFSTDVCLRPWKVISVAIDSNRRPHFSLSDSTQTSDSPTCNYRQKHTKQNIYIYIQTYIDWSWLHG